MRAIITTRYNLMLQGVTLEQYYPAPSVLDLLRDPRPPADTQDSLSAPSPARVDTSSPPKSRLDPAAGTVRSRAVPRCAAYQGHRARSLVLQGGILGLEFHNLRAF